MEGLRCAVCRERLLVGESACIVGDITVSSDGEYQFNTNEEGEQEVCALHSTCGTIVLYYEKDGKPCHIAIA